ncbi:Mobile element protein (plasmid) [Sinorhizobium fredii CCBAU 83666]|nr:Mobile element protein [Sinorhizobium fredii CCBAU 83666]
MAERAKQIPSKARGRPPLADWGLVEEIKAIIADMPTCGYRRVHAILLETPPTSGVPGQMPSASIE